MNNTMLHERLVELRQCHNMKQFEVADRIGIVRSTYSGYERGTRTPDAYTLSRIADFYHVTTDYLLGKDVYNTAVPEQLIKIVTALSPSQQKEFWDDIIKYAKYITFKG